MNQNHNEAALTESKARQKFAAAVIENVKAACTSKAGSKEEKSRYAIEVLQSVWSNQKLVSALASPEGMRTFLDAVSQAARLNLCFSGSIAQCYLIPYGSQIRLHVSYMGMMKVCRDNGIEVTAVNDVCENDILDSIDLNSGDPPAHGIDLRKSRGKIIGYYCSAKNKNSGQGRKVYMTKEEVELWRDKYCTQSIKGKITFTDAWSKHFDAMAKKTVIRKCLKYLGYHIGDGEYQDSGDYEKIINDVGAKAVDVLDKANGDFTQAPKLAEVQTAKEEQVAEVQDKPVDEDIFA